MATSSMKTAFDLIGLTAYFTLMMGELPDRELLINARNETGSMKAVPPQPPRRGRSAQTLSPSGARRPRRSPVP